MPSGTALRTIADHSAAQDITFFGFDYSPFVQRAWIAIDYLQIPYKHRSTRLNAFDVLIPHPALSVEVDPKNKPAELFKASPKGIVPAITMHNYNPPRHMTESAVIMEYLDEIARKTSGRSLLPSDEYARALVRLLAEHVTKEGRAFYGILTAKTEEDLAKFKKAYIDGISAVEIFYTRMEKELEDCPESQVKAIGLWHEGGGLGWVDVLFAPWLGFTLNVLKELRGFEWPQGGKVLQWAQRVAQHPSVRAACSGDEVYLNYYRSYLPSRD